MPLPSLPASRLPGTISEIDLPQGIDQAAVNRHSERGLLKARPMDLSERLGPAASLSKESVEAGIAAQRDFTAKGASMQRFQPDNLPDSPRGASSAVPSASDATEKDSEIARLRKLLASLDGDRDPSRLKSRLSKPAPAPAPAAVLGELADSRLAIPDAKQRQDALEDGGLGARRRGSSQRTAIGLQGAEAKAVELKHAVDGNAVLGATEGSSAVPGATEGSSAVPGATEGSVFSEPLPQLPKEPMSLLSRHSRPFALGSEAASSGEQEASLAALKELSTRDSLPKPLLSFTAPREAELLAGERTMELEDASFPLGVQQAAATMRSHAIVRETIGREAPRGRRKISSPLPLGNGDGSEGDLRVGAQSRLGAGGGDVKRAGDTQNGMRRRVKELMAEMIANGVPASEAALEAALEAAGEVGRGSMAGAAGSVKAAEAEAGASWSAYGRTPKPVDGYKKAAGSGMAPGEIDAMK